MMNVRTKNKILEFLANQFDMKKILRWKKKAPKWGLCKNSFLNLNGL